MRSPHNEISHTFLWIILEHDVSLYPPVHSEQLQFLARGEVALDDGVVGLYYNSCSA